MSPLERSTLELLAKGPADRQKLNEGLRKFGFGIELANGVPLDKLRQRGFAVPRSLDGKWGITAAGRAALEARP